MVSWTDADVARHNEKVKRGDKADTQLPDAQQRQCAQPLAGDSSGKAQGAICPLVRFTLCRVRLLDVDAKYASVKDLLDGLAHAGLIHGDKEGQVRLEVEQEKVIHFEEERTIVKITYQ